MPMTREDAFHTIRGLEYAIQKLQEQIDILRHEYRITQGGAGRLVLTKMMEVQSESYGRLGGLDKIGTIKLVRELTYCSLKEAKDLVEALPAVLGDYADDHPAVLKLHAGGATFIREQ